MNKDCNSENKFKITLFGENKKVTLGDADAEKQRLRRVKELACKEYEAGANKIKEGIKLQIEGTKQQDEAIAEIKVIDNKIEENSSLSPTTARRIGKAIGKIAYETGIPRQDARKNFLSQKNCKSYSEMNINNKPSKPLLIHLKPLFTRAQ